MPANKKTIYLIITIIILVLLLAGGIYFWREYQPKPKPAEAPKKETPTSLGEQLYEQIQNPAEKIPQTNPFKAKTNPFEETKINPFESIYKNPFE